MGTVDEGLRRDGPGVGTLTYRWVVQGRVLSRSQQRHIIFIVNNFVDTKRLTFGPFCAPRVLGVG